MYFPSGDQRGDESRGPAVNCFVAPSAVETSQIAVLQPSFFSLTVTFTNATRAPSGATCGSAIQLKLNRSFSVTFLFCVNADGAKTSAKTTSNQRARISENPFVAKWQ